MATFDQADLVRLRIALTRISRAMNREAAAEGLTRTQLSVLGSVAARGPIGTTELAQLEAVNPTMLSRIVRKLETLGLIRRTPAPNDGRAIMLSLTTAGHRVRHAEVTRRTALLARHLDGLSPDEADALVASLPVLESVAEAMRCGLIAARS
ncbi:MAG: MarR family transcriptional regulator [Actinobacteria bacterium]|nr:MarR family transcriptional regulator [Actinomycetota bacterium]